MRNASARLRVVQKLSGGAQLLLPGSDTTIAIRAYFPKDLANIKGDDGLVAFRNAFKYPICFFVLPPGIAQQEHLSNPTSFVSLAQLIMSNRDGTTGQQKVHSMYIVCRRAVLTQEIPLIVRFDLIHSHSVLLLILFIGRIGSCLSCTGCGFCH